MPLGQITLVRSTYSLPVSNPLKRGLCRENLRINYAGCLKTGNQEPPQNLPESRLGRVPKMGTRDHETFHYGLSKPRTSVQSKTGCPCSRAIPLPLCRPCAQPLCGPAPGQFPCPHEFCHPVRTCRKPWGS